MPETTHLLIANPVAGRGLGRRRSGAAMEALSAAGIKVDLHMTRNPGDARDVAQREAGRYACLIALGGDGTIQEVAGGLARARLEAPIPQTSPLADLGILPAGTGNDLVKALKLPRKLDEAVAILIRGKTRTLDLGRIRWRCEGESYPRERVFSNNVGLGFEGQVGYAAESIRLPLRGIALYTLALGKVLRSLATPPMKILFDGGASLDGPRLLVSIGNGHSCGGGFQLTPNADPFDGKLDVCTVGARKPSQVLRFIPRAMKGTHTTIDGVSIHRQTTIEVEGGPFHGHADGELLGENIVSAHVEILPGLQPVIC